ncbi:MAG: magnesium transporter [Firmicutes bacterium]|nr:magnesium transporter [Bacillota bacterium]
MDNEKTFDEITEEIVELVADKQYIKARDLLLKNNEVDIAEILEEILEEVDAERTVILFRMLPKDVAVEVFSYLPPDDQKAIINVITDKEINYIIEEMDFDDMIDVLEELPANLVDKILEQTPKDERKQINTFLNYPEDCAGTLMTPDYIMLKMGWTVREAMVHIKEVGMDSETIYTCYVKDAGRRLKGIVSLRTLVISEDDVLIKDLMHTDFVSVNVYDDREEVSEAFTKYGFLAIPVVDNENRLVGIITVDDIFDVIEEETTEDIERMAGVIDSSDEEYLDMSVWKHVKNRLPWLFILMCSYIITGGIIAGFENELSKVICLVAYMPMLMGTGGNSGAQSATLIIRGLSVGDIDLKDAGKVLWKEARVSFFIGLALSILNFLRIIYIEHNGVGVALTVCIAMIATIVAAKVLGGMLPLLAKKIGIDPALMASPMIASLTDMISVVTYFLLASVILSI